MRWFVAGLLVVSLGVVGCEDKPGRFVNGKLRLTTEEELATLERGLLERVEQNRVRSCPRPVLRGEAVVGRAGPDIVAVVEGADDTRACLAELEKQSQHLSEALSLAEGQKVGGWPDRHWRALPALAKDPVLDGLVKTCAPLVARVRKAVGYADACSPFLPGLRGQPAYINLIRVSRLIAYHARRLLAAGEARAAAELLLDGLRLGQDFARGPVSLLEAMVAVGATPELLAAMEELLNQEKPLGAGLLTDIERELGLLVESAAHPATFLTGEMDGMALYALLPGAKEKGWQPPGGWGLGSQPPNLDGAAAELDGVDPIDGVVLAWFGMREMWAEVLAGCKAGDLPLVCQERLHALAVAGAKVPTDDWSAMGEMLKTLDSQDKVAAMRRKIIDILKAVAAPGFDRYVARQGAVVFSLQALRLLSAARRLAEQADTCPPVKAFDAAQLASLRRDPYSGQPIRVEALGPRRLVFWPPVDLKAQADLEAPPGVFMACPPGAE